eukprot:COSAG05_NODE_3616_length_1958_cov_1.297472_3_plen_142_part_00
MAIAAILARRQQDDMSRNELEEAQRKEKFKVVFDAKEAREKAKKAFEDAINDADKAQEEEREAHEAEEQAKKEVREAEAAEREADAEAREAHEAEEAALKEVAEAEAAEVCELLHCDLVLAIGRLGALMAPTTSELWRAHV